MATREQVCALARAWIGTPYHPHARVRGVGVDCAQILVAVFHAAGLCPDLDLGNYSPQWHLHRSEEAYLAWLDQYATRVDAAHPREVGPGDVAVWRFGRTFSHAGILISDTHVVHALKDEGRVTVTALHEQPLAGRAVRFYTLFPAQESTPA